MQKSSLQCIGFIMDGNRRWAKAEGLSSLEGHQKGFEVFKQSIDLITKADISHAVYYAFSTENWQREKAEVSYLMDLFFKVLDDFEKEIEENGKRVQFRVIGRVGDFSTKLQNKIKKLEEKSKAEDGEKITTVWIALSYGGRAEIMEAVNKAVKNGNSLEEKDFDKLLWSADMPDPDMIVRTGGEKRLSNFLTWRSVYSELYFTDKHWPALTENDFKDILMTYEKRERRRGR